MVLPNSAATISAAPHGRYPNAALVAYRTLVSRSALSGVSWTIRRMGSRSIRSSSAGIVVTAVDIGRRSPDGAGCTIPVRADGAPRARGGPFRNPVLDVCEIAIAPRGP